MNFETVSGAVVEAVQFTDSPVCLKAITELAGTSYCLAYAGEFRNITINGRVAHLGDWVIRVPETVLVETMTDAAFRRLFSVAITP